MNDGQILEGKGLQDTLFKVRQNRSDDNNVDGGSYLMALWKTDDTRTFKVEITHHTCWRTRLKRRREIFARHTVE